MFALFKVFFEDYCYIVTNNYLSNCLMARYIGMNYDYGMWGFIKL
jgi:hypothetical protein